MARAGRADARRARDAAPRDCPGAHGYRRLVDVQRRRFRRRTENPATVEIVKLISTYDYSYEIVAENKSMFQKKLHFKKNFF